MIRTISSQSDTIGKKLPEVEEQKSPLKKHVLIDKKSS